MASARTGKTPHFLEAPSVITAENYIVCEGYGVCPKVNRNREKRELGL